MATSRYCQPWLIYFWTKLTKLGALECPIFRPASEGSPAKSRGAPVRVLFHKMHGKEFARSTIDLALEPTVNRDAASPMRGIVGFHYSHNAIRRWCITSTQRGISVTELRRLAGLETIEQPAMKLWVSRIGNDGRQRDVFSMQSRNRVTPSHDKHQHKLASWTLLQEQQYLRKLRSIWREALSLATNLM